MKTDCSGDMQAKDRARPSLPVKAVSEIVIGIPNVHQLTKTFFLDI